jgi:serine protease AprX
MSHTFSAVTLSLSCVALACPEPALAQKGQSPRASTSTTDAPVTFEPGQVEFNGQLWTVRKSIENGRERLTYSNGRLTLDQAGVRQFVAGQKPMVISRALADALAAAANDELLDVVVVLREQPAGPIGREVRARIEPQVQALTQQMQDAVRLALARPSMPRELERVFQPPPIPPADQLARRQAAQQLDDLRRDARQEIFQRLSAAVQPTQQALTQAIIELGGEVRANIVTLNALGARLPANAVAALADHPLVAGIDLDHPGQPELDNHRHSLGLETGFWANSIDGGVHDVGVLDTGVQQNHPALSSHPFLSNMGATDTGSHGTGMAGILASTNTTYRGMAFGCDKIVVALAGSITTSMPGMDYIASTGEPENTNYSFGNGTANSTDYGTTDQFFDGVIDTFGFMVSKSTGNGGYHVTNPTITHPAPAYNLMASANMDDFNSVPRADDRITSSSSVGPTFGGRKKPDITAPGNNSMSCTPSGGFANIGGTSSASPHTGGGIVLLTDMGVTDVMAAKAVLLNTTDAMTDSGTSSTGDDAFVQGSLWNRRYGWGYLNLGAAYLNGLDVFLDSVPPAPETADFKLYTGQMFDKERATLTWQRHVAYSGASFPTQIESLSDLDLRAYRAADNGLLASSVSPIDNVEQLHVNENANVVLKVEAFGNFDPDIPSESFALATQENFTAATGPAFKVSLNHPASAPPGGIFDAIALITNTGDLPAHNVQATFGGTIIVLGPNPASIGTIGVGQTANVQWIVSAPGAGGTFPISVEVVSNS